MQLLPTYQPVLTTNTPQSAQLTLFQMKPGHNNINTDHVKRQNLCLQLFLTEKQLSDLL